MRSTRVAAASATLPLLALLPATAAGATPAGPPPRPAAGPGPDTSLATHAYP